MNSVSVDVNKEKETVTYTTDVTVEGKLLELSVTKLLYYQKPYQLDHSLKVPKGVDLFEELFYWPLEKYTNKALNHSAHNMLCSTNYENLNGLKYEVQWKQKLKTT